MDICLPPVSCQVKCYTQTLLTSFDVVPVKRITLFHSAKTCILVVNTTMCLNY